MDKKYWVPALERAHAILAAVAARPGKLKLTDLCEATGINKSSMFSLLRTMETLAWVSKGKDETYSLDSGIAYLNEAFLASRRQSSNLVERFLELSKESVSRVGETFQLSVLDRGDILYLAKQEGPSLVRLESRPGMRFPAYATAMGKMMLSALGREQLEALYPARRLAPVTPHTVTEWEAFGGILAEIRVTGYALDKEEVIKGICCVAAPVRDEGGTVIASVSTSMLKDAFEEKQALAIREAVELADMLSGRTGAGDRL